MKRLYIFRTNLRNLEYYHEYKELEKFQNNCHDFYLLFGLNCLKNNYFDEVIIWRLYDKIKPDIIFEINGKKFIQKWITDINELFKYPKPDISFWRGGFPQYCELTKKDPDFFGLKLYLAAGKRLLPQYGGIYDKILIEDERDKNDKSVPFYKTTNDNIFKPLNLDKKYDICIISNFSQIKYKGTDILIEEISKSKFLRKLKFCHCGNNPRDGIKLSKKLGVTNIEYLGSKERPELNYILNQSKIGIVNSNRIDGCPRVITEILTSGTPLLINEDTRLLKYYKKCGVVEFNRNNLIEKTDYILKNYNTIQKELIDNLNRFEINIICKLNLDLWE
jgi:hypothetical protein